MCKDILNFARKVGFSHVAVLSTDQIVFDLSYRNYCKENLCGEYGTNYSCPPLCATPSELIKRVKTYSHLLVLSKRYNLKDCAYASSIEGAQKRHHILTVQMAEYMKELGYRGFIIGASKCLFCTPCAMQKNKPCPSLEKRYSPLSAFCIDAKDMARKCGINYEAEHGKTPLFSMYVYDLPSI